MVKSSPRIEQIRQQRRRKRSQLNRREEIRIELQQSIPPSNPLKRRSPSSPSLSSQSPISPHFSLSSPESSNPNFSTKITNSQSGQSSFLDPKLPRCPDFLLVLRNSLGLLPPLPPIPSQQLLRRTVSDPVPFGSLTPRPSQPLLRTVSDPNSSFGSLTPPRNVSGLSLGSPSPLNSSSKRLRRTNKQMNEMRKNKKKKKMMFGEEDGHGGSASQSTNICSQGKGRERGVEAIGLEGDWIMIKISCPCGSNYQFVISETDKKCYYKLL